MHYFKYGTTLIFIFFLNIHFMYAAEPCAYQKEIKQCNDANIKGGALTIKDFLCIDDPSQEKIIFQIVLDKEFKKIDIQIETYLAQLEMQKDQYFNPQTKLTYINAIDDIEKKFDKYGEYWQAYNEVCGENLVTKVMACNNGSLSISHLGDFLEGGVCMDIANTGLENYKQVALDILALDKMEVRKKNLQKFMADEHSKYEKLLDLMMINLGYLDRILHKWIKKLQNTL